MDKPVAAKTVVDDWAGRCAVRLIRGQVPIHARGPWLLSPAMGWEDVLGDIEAQATGIERLDVDVDAAVIAHAEQARCSLLARWQAGSGRLVELRLTGGHTVGGAAAGGGTEVLFLAGPATLVRPDALVTVVGALSRSVASGPVPDDPDIADVAGLGWAAALRVWSRHRRLITLGLIDGLVLQGTAIAVGLDHLDLVRHDRTTPLTEASAAPLIVSFRAVAFVRADG